MRTGVLSRALSPVILACVQLACSSDASAISLRHDASTEAVEDAAEGGSDVVQDGSDVTQDGADVAQSGLARLLFEDCEYEGGTTHFLERHYGTNYQEYFDAMTTLVGQSAESPLGGSFCATWNPWVDGTFHTVLGLGPLPYGNTSGFSIGPALKGGTRVYFRWWMRWQQGIDYSNNAQHTLLSVNGGTHGDFSLTINKNASDKLHVSGFSRSPDEIRENLWLTHAGGSLDNMQWHQLEAFLEWTGTGPSGTLWIEIDDIELLRRSDWFFRDSDETTNDIEMFSIPGSTVGTPTGNAQEWWDDIEVWNDDPNGT